METNEFKLLPCPFCGVVPKTIAEVENFWAANKFFVSCSNELCPLEFIETHAHVDAETAARAWNSRAT